MQLCPVQPEYAVFPFSTVLESKGIGKGRECQGNVGKISLVTCVVVYIA